MSSEEEETEFADAGEIALEFVSDVVAAIGLDVEVSVEFDEVEEAWNVEVEGDDAARLVGHHGRTLNALQYLTSLVVQRQTGDRQRVNLDADGYKAKRRSSLEQTAREIAAEVVRTGQEAELDPLNAYERRLIHNELAEYPGVRTYSEGEDPDRRVIIAPASAEDESGAAPEQSEPYGEEATG